MEGEGLSKKDWKFNESSRIAIIGPSQCGKSELILDLIKDKDFFVDGLDGVIYCCKHSFGKKSYMERMKEICSSQDMSINFLDHIPTGTEIAEEFNPEGKKKLFIILEDFLAFHRSEQVILESLMTEHSHHLNFCIAYVTQTPFDKNLVNPNRNLTHRIIFQNYNDSLSFSLLNNRLYPKNSNFLKKCLKKAWIKRKCKYIIVNTDLYSNLPCENRVYTDAVGNKETPFLFDLNDPDLK